MSEDRIYEVNIVDDFQCLAADCPSTCCKNWNILYDPDSYRKVVKLKGPIGRRLRLYSSYNKELGAFSVHTVMGICPHYRKHLCSIQCQGHEECMPQVCRLYPRRTVSYGSRKEVTLELACIHAAEMMLMHKGEVYMQRSEREYEIFWEQKNSDQDFLDFLVEDRSIIQAYWWQEIGAERENADAYRNAFVSCLRDIYQYVYAEYMWIVRNRLADAKKLVLPIAQEDLTEEIEAPRIGRKQINFAFYPVRFMNQLIYEYLDYPSMRFQNPTLDHMVKHYRKVFGKTLEEEAEVCMIRAYEEMVAAQPDLHEAVCTYYAYLINQTYCEAYEDYYILGPALLAALFSEFYMIFLMVEYKEHGQISIRRQAEILSAMDKSLRHKNALSDRFLQVIRETYFAVPT